MSTKLDKKSVASIGGKANGVIARGKAIDLYYENPNKCKFCNSVITIGDNEKVSTVRKKVFCNQACAAKFNNNLRDKSRNPKKIRVCKKCSTQFTSNWIRVKTLCDECGDIYKNRAAKMNKSDSSHSKIRSHARYSVNIENSACIICGYSAHVEVCHIRPVSDFPPTATLSEINAVSNLVLLCPNHHWEFDHGLIKVLNGSESENRTQLHGL